MNVHRSFLNNSPSRKQPTSPSISEWLNKLCYIHTIEYYSAIEMKELLIRVTTWVNLQGIMLSGKKSIPNSDIPFRIDMIDMIPFL